MENTILGLRISLNKTKENREYKRYEMDGDDRVIAN